MAIENPKEARTRYYAIDGIRFCAALSVAIYHLFFGAWASPTSDIGRISQGAARFEAVAPYTWFLFISVEILFVISGLVIAYSANGSSTSKFVKGRLLRLYPAPWICAPITFVMICFIAPEQIYGLGEALTRLFNSLLLVPVKGCCVDGVYWTMRVEMLFYVVIILMLLTKRFSSLGTIAVALTACSSAYLICAWALELGLVERIPGWWTIYHYSLTAFVRHGNFFAVGIWLWRATQGPLTIFEKFAAIAAVAVGSAEIALHAAEMRLETPTIVDRPWWIPVSLWLATMVLMYRFTQANWAPRSAFVAALITSAGAMTYPFYLVHSVAGAGLMLVLIRNGVAVWLTPFIALFGAASIAYAVCTYWEPFIRPKLKWLFDELLEPAVRGAWDALEGPTRPLVRRVSVRRRPADIGEEGA